MKIAIESFIRAVCICFYLPYLIINCWEGPYLNHLVSLGTKKNAPLTEITQ